MSENNTLETGAQPLLDTNATGVAREKSVGQALREARVARGLSVDEVADVLRFSARQIEHLESDNYPALPGATLVRGFIRGYAKFLRLEPEHLLRSLDVTVPPETSDVRAPTRIGEAHESAGSMVLAPGRLAGIVVGVIFVLVLVYLYVQMDQAPVKEGVGATAPVVGAPAPSESKTAVTLAPLPTEPQSAAPIESDKAVTVEVQSVAAPSASPTSESALASAGLAVDFDDLSWIEVRDAEKNIVFVGEYPKGTRRTIEGKAPFTLWIGRASVVRVTYRGQAVDLKANTREDVARLTLE